MMIHNWLVSFIFDMQYSIQVEYLVEKYSKINQYEEQPLNSESIRDQGSVWMVSVRWPKWL